MRIKPGILLAVVVLADILWVGPALQSSLEGRTPAPTGPAHVAAIQAQVHALDLVAHERVWDRVHWVPSLERARALARKTGSPIFLFSMWGDLDGRC